MQDTIVSCKVNKFSPSRDSNDADSQKEECLTNSDAENRVRVNLPHSGDHDKRPRKCSLKTSAHKAISTL